MKSNTKLFRRMLELSVLIGAGCICAGHAWGATATGVPARVVEAIKDSDSVRLVGNTHPLAKSDFDRGLVCNPWP